MFADEVILELEAGNGGAGAVSFLHEKYREFGGPDGGDGGKGGDIYIIGNRNLQSLSHLIVKRKFKAENGVQGGKYKKTGKHGNDINIYVPLGTTIIDHNTNQILCDIENNKQNYMIAKGGIGGKGNFYFRSATNQAPRYAQSGISGEIKKIKLELKIIADIGFVGFPNAGKSSLLSVLTHATPKIANYPFSTLHPNLGTFLIDDYHSITLADIPGLIEGAHKGLGLGIKFLKHIERTKMIFFLIDLSDYEYEEHFDKLQNELESFHKSLKQKDYIVILTKIDMIENDIKDERIEYFIDKGIEESKIFPISNLTLNGFDNLKEYLRNTFQEKPILK